MPPLALLQEATSLRKQNADLQAALAKSQEESAVLTARLEEAAAAAADNAQLLAVVRSRIAVLEKAYAAAVEVRAVGQPVGVVVRAVPGRCLASSCVAAGLVSHAS